MNEKERIAQNLRLVIQDSEAWLDDTKFRDQVMSFCQNHIDKIKESYIRGGMVGDASKSDFEAGGAKKLQDLIDAITKADERKTKALEELKKYD